MDDLAVTYFLDYLRKSDQGVSVQSISKMSGHSRKEIRDTRNQLLDDGLISDTGAQKYVITRKGKRYLEDNIFDRIARSYDTYLKKVASSGAVAVAGPNSESPPYALKSSIAAKPESSPANFFGGIYTGDEEDHFLTKQNTLPSVEELSTLNLERLPILLVRMMWVHVSEENHRFWELIFRMLSEFGSKLGFGDISKQMPLRILFSLALSNGQDLAMRLDLQTTSHEPHAVNHTSEVLHRTTFIASFVAYPVLESFIKTRCEEDIESDGKVRRDNTVRDYSPNTDRDYYDTVG